MIENDATIGITFVRSLIVMLVIGVLACLRTNNPSELHPA